MIATVVLVAGAATAAAAQQSDILPPGVRVRVTTSAVGLPARYAGTLIAITPESVSVGGIHSRTVSVRSVERLELSLGTSHGLSAKKGLKRGLILGGVLGVLVGVQFANAPVCRPGISGPCRTEGVSGSTMVMRNTVLFGTIGGLSGVTIGSLFTSERWTEVPFASGR